MSEVRVAVVGLSGVGKSTFIKTRSEFQSFTHLEASHLIKDELQRLYGRQESSEALRKGAIIDNQELLIRSFKRNAKKSSNAIVLDAHNVIDTNSGLKKIPRDVFSACEIKTLYFLYDDPKKIVEKRTLDEARIRPVRSIEEISEQQNFAMSYASDIAREMLIPITFISHKVQSFPIPMLRQSYE